MNVDIDELVSMFGNHKVPMPIRLGKSASSYLSKYELVQWIADEYVAESRSSAAHKLFPVMGKARLHRRQGDAAVPEVCGLQDTPFRHFLLFAFT